MATAVETSSEPRAPRTPANLPFASLVGAVYLVLAVVVVLYALPAIWDQFVSPALSGFSFVNTFCRILVQLAAAAGLWIFGQTLAGSSPPKGLRGGIFLILSWAIATFFLARSVGLQPGFTGNLFLVLIFVVIMGSLPSSAGGNQTLLALAVAAGIGMMFLIGGAAEIRNLLGAVAVLVLLIVAGVRLFTSAKGERWMVGLEEQGWFHAHQYKKALGQKVRRLTILGLLLIGGSGVYSLMYHGMIGEPVKLGDEVVRVWQLAIPFTAEGGVLEGRVPPKITISTHADYVIPIVLLLLTLWLAFRVVNMPSFAEFLIATEAEMNKVSWTSKRRLGQDTVVVLVTTIMLTVFLLVVDFFWSWLLSRQIVGVLPTLPDAHQQKHIEEAKW